MVDCAERTWTRSARPVAVYPGLTGRLIPGEFPMLGPPKSRRLDAPIAVSLEAPVPVDHFYRHLEAKLDLGFVRELVRTTYKECGRPSVDPVVFFKLQTDS